MSKQLAHSLFNISQVASSSNAGSVFIGGLGGGAKARVKPPRVPFVSEMIKIRDVDCCLHTYYYDPDDSNVSERPPVKGLIVFLHGANTHGTFPTTRLVADLMLANGYAFMAPDFPGHGRSSGLRGYVESGEKLIDFGVDVVEYSYRRYLETKSLEKVKTPNMPTSSTSRPGLKLFLIGSSMGGNISLQVAIRRSDLVTGGVVLMAPMLKIKLITPFTRFFIKHSAGVLPLAEAVPLGRNNNYRCPKIREECEKDTLKPFQEGDKIRLGSVKSLVDLTDTLEAKFENVSCPCLVMIGDEDKTLNNKGAVDLVKRARSEDMTLKRYPALHGLMGEPSPLLDRMQDDMVRWLDERSNREYFIRSSL